LVKGINRASAIIGVYQIGEDLAKSYTYMYDKARVEWDMLELNSSIMEVNAAIRMNLIPKEYQTKDRLAAITNYVLQGVGDSKDPNVAKIGKNVYDTFHPSTKKENNDSKEKTSN
jgi:hypothetical protein